MNLLSTSNANLYTPLNALQKEIRVLRLDHELGEHEPLCFQMSTVSLSEPVARPYCAISYTWGVNPERTRMRINGKDAMVPRSAAEALRGILYNLLHTTEEAASTALWIDAICIDQENRAEKSWQVAMMDDLYSKAGSVFVWLGPADHATATSTVQTLVSLNGDCLQWTNGLPDLETITKRVVSSTAREGTLPYWSSGPPEDCDWESVLSLIHNRWFNRLWTVQEYVLARRVSCFIGHCSIDFDDLARALMWFKHRSTFDSIAHKGRDMWFSLTSSLRLTTLRNLLVIRQRLLNNTVEPMTGADAKFPYAMRLALQLQTTEPRDRIYALLGLASRSSDESKDSFAAHITPDYNKSLCDVYSEATWLTLRSTGSFRLIESAQHWLPPPDECTEDWPSWVPRYHLGTPESCYRHYNPTYRDSPDASDGSVAEVQLHPENVTVLQARGVSIGTVNEIYAPPLTREHAYWEPSMERYRETDAILLQHFTYLWHPDLIQEPDHGSMSMVLRYFAATLLGGYYHKSGIEARFAEFLLRVKEYCKGSISKDLERLCQQYMPFEEPELDYLIELASSGAYYTLADVSNGKLALCPPAVAPGDEICILLGARYPWVVRKHEAVWKIVGPCVVSDLMHVSASNRRTGASLIVTQGELIEALKEEGCFEEHLRTYDIN